MRLMPKSLFGRLALVLLAGLILAQLVGTAILFHERGQRLTQSSGLHSAGRIAEIVRLLDAADATGRRRLATILDTPPMRVSLTTAPWPTNEHTSEEKTAGRFRARLEKLLGARYPVRVAVSDRAPVADEHNRGSMGMMCRGGMGMHRPGHNMGTGILPPEALTFFAQVQLADGSWVTFENQIPKEVFTGTTELLLMLAVLLFAVVTLSLIAVRWVTRPLSMLAEAADELGRDIDRPALSESGPIESRQAARAFNTMQTRLKRYIDDRTRLLSAVSHDLKTPITRLRLRAELLDDDSLRDSFVKDLDEMQVMAAETLGFLRGMESKEVMAPVDIGALLESLKVDAEVLNHKVEVTAAELAPYPARPLALKRCLNNLIDNAVKYGGRALVTATDSAESLTITVADDGPGIPEAELEQVFEPFYRLEGSRSRDTGGTGLGLSLARNIALAHGGELRLQNRPEGGLEAVLTLPRTGKSQGMIPI